MPLTSRRALVLLVEDSDDDSFFFQWTVQKCGIDCDVAHIADGVRALEHLASVRLGRSPRPDIVFLDLKLPGLSGFDILKCLQSHPFNPPLPVVILSGSEHITDVDRARELGAFAYHVKPLPAAELRAIVGATVNTPAEEPVLLNRLE